LFNLAIAALSPERRTAYEPHQLKILIIITLAAPVIAIPISPIEIWGEMCG